MIQVEQYSTCSRVLFFEVYLVHYVSEFLWGEIKKINSKHELRIKGENKIWDKVCIINIYDLHVHKKNRPISKDPVLYNYLLYHGT